MAKFAWHKNNNNMKDIYTILNVLASITARKNVFKKIT